MRHLAHGAVLAILALAIPTSAVPSFSSNSYPPHPAEPVSLFLQTQPQTAPGLWTRVRNSLIETVWGVPPQHRNRKPADRHQSSLSSAPPSLRARYGDDVVLRFSIQDETQVKALVEASNILFLDIWSSTDEWVDIRLAKDVVPSLLGLLPKPLQTSHVPLIHDLAQTVYESYPSASQRESDGARGFSPSTQHSDDVTNIFFQDYQPFSVIVPWMRLLASMFSSHVQLISVGSSFEGRDIPALRVGVRPANDDKPRKTIVVVGGTHAREWISVSTVNYVAYSLITTYAKSKAITKLLEQFDFVFVPTINPDGYVYSWETDRLWRKNRQETSLPFCPGIDLDRTWGFEWDGGATADNPCSESYAGDGPFAGVEANRFAEWARNQTEQSNVEFVGYLDLHSYSQQILYPYSYSCSPVPPTLENLEELAMGIAKAIRRTNREAYDVSSACEGLVATHKKQRKSNTYPRMESMGGSALDWFYHDLHVKYSYQIKLRDKGSYGFLLPRENIIPTGQELFNAIMTFGRFLFGPDAEEMNWEADFQRPATEKSTPGGDALSPEGQEGEDDSWLPDEYARHDDPLRDENSPEDDEWELRRRRRRRR
ncbi:putative metallocarboxypeptidase ecm14 [Emmonsiellopsis sp. PD_5]|nr:putative metallocarboxypeptidase ecm14 [Emmonsiellopsis sp. PD_5]